MASKKEYRIRGLTRDTTGSGAEKLREHHVEPYAIDFKQASLDEATNAFHGATYCFGLTLTSYVNDFDRSKVCSAPGYHVIAYRLAQQIAEGKLIVDAAKAAGVKLFLWSGVDSYKVDSKGKYSNALICEAAWTITCYLAGREVPTIVVQPGSYASASALCLWTMIMEPSPPSQPVSRRHTSERRRYLLLLYALRARHPHSLRPHRRGLRSLCSSRSRDRYDRSSCQGRAGLAQ